VVAVDGVEELRVVAARRTCGIPASGMFVQVMEYFQPVLRSWAVRFFLWRREGFTRRAIQRSPPGQLSALVMRPVTSATSLSCSMLPSWRMPGFHASAGRAVMAASSASVMAQPQVNIIFHCGEDMPSRCPMRSWLAPAPSTRIRSLLRSLAGTWRSAAESTSLWSAKVCEPAFPGRRSMARHSRVLMHQAVSGWKP
jgi:hypothetical protein